MNKPSNIRIMTAEPNDFEPFYRLLCILEETDLPKETFRKIYETKLLDPFCRLLCAKAGDKTIAVLNMRYEEQLHHCEKIAEILEFCVDPAWRSQSIGCHMLEYACDLAAKERCTQIELSSNQRRTNAHRFYTSHLFHNDHYNFTRRLPHHE